MQFLTKKHLHIYAELVWKEQRPAPYLLRRGGGATPQQETTGV